MQRRDQRELKIIRCASNVLSELRSDKLFGFSFGGFFVFAAIDDLIQNHKSFGLKVIFIDEAIKTFDFRALTKFFERGGKRITLNKIDTGSVFRKFYLFSHGVSSSGFLLL